MSQSSLPFAVQPNSVLKDWVHGLPFRMQSVLMSAMRGCDTARKDDVSKFVTRALRPVLCNNADPSNSFMGNEIPKEASQVEQFLWDLDSYPMHFVAHTMHAAEIVGFKHPDAKIRKWWLKLYTDMVKALHLNPETEAQLDVRLGFTPTERQISSERAKNHKWDAGTGTSHGGRERDFSGGS